MKKKQVKKLELNRETVRHLEEEKLQAPVGGVTAAVCTEATFPCSLCRTC